MSVPNAKFPDLKVSFFCYWWVFFLKISVFISWICIRPSKTWVPQPVSCTATFLAMLSSCSTWKLLLGKIKAPVKLGREKRMAEAVTCLLMRLILITVCYCKGRCEAKVFAGSAVLSWVIKPWQETKELLWINQETKTKPHLWSSLPFNWVNGLGIGNNFWHLSFYCDAVIKGDFDF